MKTRKRSVAPKPDAWAEVDYLDGKRGSIEGIADQALKGDPECVRQMMRLSITQIDRAESIQPDVKEYLLHAFAEIVSGKNADSAFGLLREGKKGARKDYWKTVRDRDMARAVAYRIQYEDMEPDEACERVAEALNLDRSDGERPVSDETVRKAFRRFYSVKLVK